MRFGAGHRRIVLPTCWNYSHHLLARRAKENLVPAAQTILLGSPVRLSNRTAHSITSNLIVFLGRGPQLVGQRFAPRIAACGERIRVPKRAPNNVRRKRRGVRIAVIRRPADSSDLSARTEDIGFRDCPRRFYRCISMMADAGIMFALRCAMIHSEPATTRVTTSSPKASASTLLVLSGPVPICRKNTK